MSRDNCPLAKNVVLTSCPTILDSVVPQNDQSVDCTDISTVDWAQEQATDVTIGRVIQLVKSGYKSQDIDQKSKMLMFQSTFVNGVSSLCVITFCTCLLCSMVLTQNNLYNLFAFIALFYNVYMTMLAIRAAIASCHWSVLVLLAWFRGRCCQ